MPATYFHLIINLFVFIPILVFFNSFSFYNLLLVVIFSCIIDIDHFFYFSYKLRTIDIRKILGAAIRDLKEDRIHFYFLHTEEFFLLFAVLIFIQNFDLTLILIFSALLLHWLVDAINHYIVHRNFDFLKNYSLIYHLTE